MPSLSGAWLWLLCLLAMACGSAGGSGPAAPGVPAPSPAITSFAASPAAVNPGQAAALAWTVTGASTLRIDPEVGPVTGTSVTVTPAATTLYTLTATNSNGAATATATVQVVAPPSITGFTAARTILTQGSSTTLLPIFANATSASIDGGVGAAASGVPVTVTPAATTTYTLTTQGLGGPVTRTVTVTVVPAPTIAGFAASPASLATGGSTQLTATFAGGTATLDHGLGAVTTGTPVPTGPLAASTTYLLTVTNAAGDSVMASTTVTVGPAVAITSFTAASATLTAGASTTLIPAFINATGATVDQGIGAVASGTAVTVTPAATTTYTLTATGLGSPVTRTVTVTVVPAPSIATFTASPAAITSGTGTRLTATFAGGTGTVDHGLGAVTTGVAVGTGTLGVSTTYLLTVTNPAGDSVTASATVTVGTAVAITGFAADHGTITAGTSATLLPAFVNATGATVDQGIGAVASGTAVTVTPAATTTYTLTAQGLGGPVTRTVTVTVVPAPGIATFNASPGTLLAGGSAQLTAVFSGGAGLIDHGLGSIATGTPLTTGALDTSATFHLTVTNAAGDSVSASTTVTVGTAVAITGFTAASATLTAGASTTLLPSFVNATGATLDNGVGAVASGAGFTVAPAATTTYTLTAQGLGGPVTRTVTVTVVAAPRIAAFSASPAAVATGASAQLTATFAGGTGAIDHALGSVTADVPVDTGALATSTTYLLTVTNPAGDSVTASATVTVGTAVAITGFAVDRGTITAGTSATLLPAFVNAAGATVDQGIGAVASGTAITVTPAATTTYTLTALGLGGAVTRTVTVTVVPAPGIATFSASPGTLLAGGSAQLTAVFSGGTGLIDHGVGSVTTGAPVTTGALGTSATFLLTVTNPAGDSVTASATVTVGTAVAITGLAVDRGTITAGTSATLLPAFVNATGATVDQGIGAVASGTAITVTPAATTTYTLTAQGLGGPVTRTVTVTVVPAPGIATFTASPAAIATGSSAQLTAVFSGGSGTIDHAVGAVTTGVPADTGTLGTSTTFLLTVTNAAGDSVNASATVTVGSAVAITGFTAASATLTEGASTTLLPSFVNATGATVDHGIGAVASGTGCTVAPAVTTVYTLTAQGLGGPVTRTLTITVVPAPGISRFTATPAAVATGGASLLAFTFSGGTATVDHGLGAVTSGVPVPTGPLVTATTFLLTVTNPAGDTATAAATVTVGSAVGITSFTASRTLLTAGASAILTPGFVNATGASIDQGVGGVASGSGYAVTPAATTTYVLTATGLNGPVTQAVTITVVPAAAITSCAASAPALGPGGATQLTPVFAGGAGLLDHGIGAVTSGVAVSTGPLAATTVFTLTVTNAAGDAVTFHTTVAVNVSLTFTAGANGTLTGSTSQTIPAGGDASAVTAVPNANYAFLNWTGTGGFATTAANPLTLTQVAANQALTANFGRLPSIASFTPTAGTIGKGQPAYLNWSSLSLFTSAAIDNGGGAVVTPNGMIAVYPTVTTTYTLTATNAAGSIQRSITITVMPAPVITSFTATPIDLAAGQATTLSWAATGAATYSINNGVGTVSGTSTSVTPPTGSTTYRLTATSAYGSSTTAQVTVSSGPPVALVYSTNPATYTRTLPITPNTPANGGGPITTYTVAPGLPAGLVLNASTGVITGTPTSTTASATYVVRGTNAYAFTQYNLTLAVAELPPAVTYAGSPFTWSAGVPVTLGATSTGGPVASWAISPALPSGLAFNTATGQITGTPTALAATQTYTVTATNTGGVSTPSFALTVTQTPPAIAYGSPAYACYVGVPIPTLVPTNTGGPVVTWAISPALPAGLTFDTSNGHIAGTPTAVASALAYTITATNPGGSSQASPTFSVAVHGPVLSVQPHGLILAPGDVPAVSVTASGTGPLSYQWYRNGSPIGGATGSSYAAPAFSAADDGAALTVVVSDTFGGSTTSAAAVLAQFQDLTTWLAAHPALAGNLKWQFQAAGANVYQAPTDADKLTWANWSPGQRAELNQAYLDAVSWYNLGAPQVTMTPGGPGLTDQPINNHPSLGTDSSAVMEWLDPAYMWKLFSAHAAMALMLEASHQLPWSIAGDPDASLRYLLDSATMGWFLSNGNFAVGTYESAGLPALRADTRPRTSFADPRWTFHWLQQAGLIGATRMATIGNTLEWMRQNLSHFNGSETFGNSYAVWQYRGFPPISRMVAGTVDSNSPGLGALHWTAGCHGSTGFLNAVLRVLNIPVQPIWVAGHELIYFVSEDRYLDHADDPYNLTVRTSSAPVLNLLLDPPTWRLRFGNDETVNILDPNSPLLAWVGYNALHFQ
jgi:hypothetical protein